jgi:Kef-type K+ transport system membrane component KefB
MDTITPVEGHLTPCRVPHSCPTRGGLALSARRPRRPGTTVTLGHRLHRPAMLTLLLGRDQITSHPQFRLKLEAVGLGIFIPVFFVTSGLSFDLSALFPSS